MLSQEDMKRLSAKQAIKYIEDDMVIGVGTGSTVKFFIEELKLSGVRINAAVASSEDTKSKLKLANIPVVELNSVGNVDIYIDGADEVNKYLQMIKGGGAALTREKIIASCSKRFICMIDETKYVDVLGNFPLPIEVIPMARSYVAREIVKLGGTPNWRQGIITDNNNEIIDVYNFLIQKPIELEEILNNIEGVVSNGIFAKKTASDLIVAYADGKVKVYN
jgi:ribose 5-phosphate isomerase A